MTPRLRAIALILILTSGTAFAHRLDEYLQATTISIEKSRVVVQLDLTPGVAVFPSVMATIDSDHDGAVSEAEQQAYVKWALAGLSLSIDGDRLRPQLTSTVFPRVDEMKEGVGSIQIKFSAHLTGNGRRRKLVFENHHLSQISVYLVNCLVPDDPDIRVTAQNRNYQQSFYQLEYSQAGFAAWWPDGGWIGLLAIALLCRLFILWRRQSVKASLLSTV